MRIDLKSKKLNIIVLVVVIIITLLCASFYCAGSDIKADEVFSMGFANNTEGFLFMTRGVCDVHSIDGWLSTDFFRNYFGVESGEGFSFVQIYRNVRHDVHPPAYFMILNAVSTLCGGEPSALPGSIINVIVSLIMVYVLFLIGKKLYDNPLFAMLIPLMWVGSYGAMDSIQYIRMYLSFSTIVVIEVYLSMLLMEGKKNNTIYVLIGLFAYVGTLTHYYFYVAFFFIAVYVVVWHVRLKEYKGLAKYIGILAGFEIISVCMWPYVYNHILHSDRGEQAMGNLANANMNYYIDHLKGFAKTYNNEVFNGYGQYIVTVLLVLLIVSVLLTKCGNNTEPSTRVTGLKTNLGLITFTTVGYFLVLFKVSYSYRWLYVSPTFALVDIIIVTVIVYIFRHSNKILAHVTLLATLAIIAWAMMSLLASSLGERAMSVQRYDSKKEIFDGRQVFFIYDDWSDTIDNQSFYLMNAEYICFVDSKDIENFDWEEQIRKCPGDTSELIFMISNANGKSDEEFEDIISAFDNKNHECVWVDNYLIQYVER